MEMYVLDTSALSGREDEALSLLTSQRREKALRLPPGPVRARSIGAGLLLRRFFGQAEVRLTPRGKPYVPGGREFSLSHSGDIALIALHDRRVGADAERPRPVSDDLLRRVLSEEERRWAAQREDGFAFLWTRKEALLKCPGFGIDRPLAALQVLPGETPVLEGKAYALHTARFGEYVLSAAAEDDALFTPRELPLEELLG